jgi:hypothetical protein
VSASVLLLVLLVRANTDFRDKAPLSAAQAATIILDGVRSGTWRILVGEDATRIDATVRAKPEAACDYAELFSAESRPGRAAEIAGVIARYLPARGWTSGSA